MYAQCSTVVQVTIRTVVYTGEYAMVLKSTEQGRKGECHHLVKGIVSRYKAYFFLKSPLGSIKVDTGSIGMRGVVHRGPT